MATPLYYSCLENSMDRGAWQATVHGITYSWTQLSDSYKVYLGNILLHAELRDSCLLSSIFIAC